MNLSYSTEIDFSAAKVITTRFARILMERKMPETVKVLKLEIPDEATVDTPWRVARLGMNPYYRLTVPQRKSWDTPNRIRYHISLEGEELDPRSDIHALAVERVISVTPLHLDLTAPVDLDELDKFLRN
jgi:5'-nucleotidase